jgi:5'/3'-nucleotidase SurE
LVRLPGAGGSYEGRECASFSPTTTASTPAASRCWKRSQQVFSDDIWAVAPAEEQSGAGHSLTLTQPIRLRRHDNRRFSVNGTPTDAVMLALAHVMKDSPPDLILSGINRGANLGEDVTYSGTVSAAMEGALAGVRSIALSQSYSREGMGDRCLSPPPRPGQKGACPLIDYEPFRRAR